MILFDGKAFAKIHEDALLLQVKKLHEIGIYPKIAAILFTEDAGSQLYTTLKKQTAEQVGIGYEVHSFSIADPVEKVYEKIDVLNQDPTITGIIIQKPAKKTWLMAREGDFQAWWQDLTIKISENKDVDGLHPKTLAAIENGTWKEQHKVLPATAKAVLAILKESEHQLRYNVKEKKITVIGRSDILGKPLFYELRNQGCNVEMIGRHELTTRIQNKELPLAADVLISSTGQENVITGDLVKEGAVVVDVGEPRPDIDATSVAEKTAFLTPVPGGVGPMTIVSLLENSLVLVQQ